MVMGRWLESYGGERGVARDDDSARWYKARNNLQLDGLLAVGRFVDQVADHL